MFKKKIYLFVLGILLFCSFGFAYTIDGNTVSYSNQYGQINVTPHTSLGFLEHTQYMDLTSYMTDQNLDFAFVFNTSVEGKIYLWNGNEWLDKTYLIERDYFKDNYIYWVKNVFFEDHETKRVKIVYRVAPFASGKWDLYIKQSGVSIEDAIVAGHYVHLDPWYNDTYTSRIEANISNYATTAVLDYIAYIPINTTGLIADGNMTSDCNMLPIDPVTNDTYAFYVERCNNDSTILKVKMTPLPKGNTTIHIYYSNDTTQNLENENLVYGNCSAALNFNNSVTIFDSSPHSWDWTPFNSPQLVTGKYGTGLLFDGMDDYIKVGKVIPNSSSNQVIVDFWFKPNYAIGYMDKSSVIKGFLYGDSGSYTYQNNFNGASDGTMYLRIDGGQTSVVYSDKWNMSNANWYHIQYYINWTHRDIYVNGILNKTNAVSVTAYLNNGSSNACFGNDCTPSAGRYINGTVDELIIKSFMQPTITKNATHSVFVPDSLIIITVGLAQNNYNDTTPVEPVPTPTMAGNTSLSIYVRKYCTDNFTLTTLTNMTNCTISENTTCISGYTEFNEICNDGCDFRSNECNPNTFYQSLIFFGMVVFFVFGYWIILFFSKMQRDLSYMVAFIMMIISLGICANLPTYFDGTVTFFLFLFPITYLLAGVILAFKS